LFSGSALASPPAVSDTLLRDGGGSVRARQHLLAVAALAASMFVVDRRWQHRQHRLEKVTGIMNESHAYSMNLVRHFMPSFKVQKYQFRGMQAKAGTADIEFSDLSLTLRSGRRVLEGVSGEFKAGRLCAIMGPSGAGKTTFMNVLCGKATYGKMGGTIRVNGQEAEISQFKSVTGFVPQDDIVHNDLTVREQIEFSARLRNSVGTDKKKIQAIAQDVLNVMQIDHIRNSIVGSVEQRGISGGQRKRVNIGLELAALPTVLFLDEPTSGLDSTSSLAVAISLKKMSELGMTTIMVIHQPRYSLFTLFDDALLLGKGGRTVYLGPSLGARPYFESLGFSLPQNDNPADWFMDVLSGEVENPQITDFKPEMLFDTWIEKKEKVSSSEFREANPARVETPQEQRSMLARALENEWDTVDRNRNGVMDAQELQGFLRTCSNAKPTPEVISTLLEEMAGAGETSVSKAQFLEFLVSLGNVLHSHSCGEDPSQEAGPVEAKIVAFLAPVLHSVQAGLDATGSFVNLQSQHDIAGSLSRQTPGFFQQYGALALRRLIQWWRMNPLRAVFMSALCVGGAGLACLDKFVNEHPAWECFPSMMSHVALALLLAIFSLQVFGVNRPMFWRESASGVNRLAYFQSRTDVNTIDLVLMSLIFAGSYFVVRQPALSFGAFFLPYLLNAYTASGWGYFISTAVPPKNQPFLVSLITIVFGLIGHPSQLKQFLDGGAGEGFISSLSITRWSMQMSFHYAYTTLEPMPCKNMYKSFLGEAKTVFFKRDLGMDPWWAGFVALSIIGTILRVASFLCLRFLNRDKQV